MGVFNKIKNFFVEEVEEDEEEEEVREPEQQYARKVEVPKKSFKERFKLREKLEEEDDDEEEKEPEQKVELEEQEPNVYIPKNSNISFEEDEINPAPKEETPMEEKEEVELPSRSSRTPLVFEDDNLFQEDDDYKPVMEENEEEEEEPEVEMEEEEEESEVTPPPKEKYRPPLLYQGRKESNYIDSINKENYYKQGNKEDKGEKKFKPSPIISPIYGILDKNYKKEEIRSKSDYKRNMEKKECPIDSVRKKAYGEERKPIREEVHEERPIKSEKKVNLTHDVPTVSDVTIAEADDYYNELGFVYNVNYKNETRNQPSKKKVEKKETEINDNLFDLVDSMHDKKED